ncbi:hypothetical protein EU527_16005 [Candidatus Thorarchaeota archaeon]|nr:MAG: hypothetical protein EU527_16005 [Candidatus Thorarchaeota archaeon]
MKIFRRAIGVLITLVSALVLVILHLFQLPWSTTDYFTILFGYLLVIFFPGLLIDVIFARLGQGLEEDIATKCGGLRYGGFLIGYVERSLIFLAIVIAYFDSALTYASILSFLSVIIAGKAIFRYSSRESSDRACADWYILGTLMSITMALALGWWIFRFLLIG